MVVFFWVKTKCPSSQNLSNILKNISRKLYVSGKENKKRITKILNHNAKKTKTHARNTHARKHTTNQDQILIQKSEFSGSRRDKEAMQNKINNISLYV